MTAQRLLRANEGLRPELNGGSRGLQIGWPTPRGSLSALDRPRDTPSLVTAQ